jgi:hypothetical protein
MTTLQNLSVSQLRKLAAIKEKIERLEAKLGSLIGERAGRPPAAPKRRVLSAVAKARIAAGQRRRWARLKGGAVSKAPAANGRRRKFSAATRARLAASAKARWAKVKAAGKSAL